MNKSICGPAHTVKEVGEREPEWHVFHALRFDNLSLIPRPLLVLETKIV